MRKVIVGIKRVADPNVRIRVNADQSGVALDGLKMAINPFDEIALEEGIRMREQGHASELIAVSVGSDDVQQQLRTALAMGADRAILVKHDGETPPRLVARTLHALIVQHQAKVVLLGKQSVDNDNGQTGPMLAALWDRPQATYASKIVFKGETLEVTREVDAGLETLSVDLPAVITVDLRLNQPRYVKLPDIMKAKKKPLEIVELASLGISERPQFRVVAVHPPKARAKGVKVRDAAELIAALKKKGLVP
jgi:electron transfer flavoprotein beta subunit